MRIMGSFRAQGVNLFPGELLLLLPARSVGSGEGWVWYKVESERSGESVTRGGFAGS